MSAAPVARYCFDHENTYLEIECVPCAQGIPPLPRAHAASPHAADLSDLNPAWAAAVAREEAAR